MRALILGARGQVGASLLATAPADATVVGHDSSSTDIRSERAVRQALADARPTVLINCAAYTRVDDAETNSADAMAVNADAPRMMAALALETGCRFLHLSTDYV